jgi:hypothetical protein
LRDIDPGVTGYAGGADSVSCRNRKAKPMLPVPVRSIGIVLAVAALCAAAAGCISDTGTSLSGAAQSPSDGGTMRYYGGPKSPMWSSQ